MYLFLLGLTGCVSSGHTSDDSNRAEQTVVDQTSEEKKPDVYCRSERVTGSNMPERVCYRKVSG